MAVMRTPESKIKQAILHPECEIRETALHYFSEARCEDESIMPLVIQAVEKYGRETSFGILRDAERLPQTDATVDWIVQELRRDYDLSDVSQENYCFALGWILHHAPQPLIWKRCGDLVTAPGFPKQLVQPIQERLERFSWDWDRGWMALKYWAEDTMRRGNFTHSDIGWVDGIVESMARHRKKKAKVVLGWLQGEYGNEQHDMMAWLFPCFLNIAGEMRLKEAVPLLVEYLDDDDIDTADSADQALQRIGGDLVVQAIDARWHRAEVGFRHSAACVLDHIRGDLCIERCLDLFKWEEDNEAKLLLADALLGNFAEDAVDSVAAFLEEIDDGLFRDEWNLRYRLIAVCQIMGRTFPRFEEWHKAALRNDWGRFGRKAARVADTFKPEVFGPECSEN